MGSIPVVGEEVGGVTGAARSQGWLLLLLLWRHHVVMDVCGPDSASLQQDPETGSADVTRHVCEHKCVWCSADQNLLASRRSTCGAGDSGSGTQSGWIRMNCSASAGWRVKQQGPTDGPTATITSAASQPNSDTMASRVAMATPPSVPRQPGGNRKSFSQVTRPPLLVPPLSKSLPPPSSDPS